jgi:hypothetical protein
MSNPNPVRNTPQFTSETARAAAVKSAQVRRARLERKQALLLPLPQGQHKPELVQGISIACLRTRLEQIDELIACCKSPDDLDSLTRAFERLFRVWQVLTETPDPGRLQPRTKKSVTIDQHLLGPISDLTPQPVVPSPGTDPATSVSGSDSNESN